MAFYIFKKPADPMGMERHISGRRQILFQKVLSDLWEPIVDHGCNVSHIPPVWLLIFYEHRTFAYRSSLMFDLTLYFHFLFHLSWCRIARTFGIHQWGILIVPEARRLREHLTESIMIIARARTRAREPSAGAGP